jgi:hypothetical protein
MAEKTQYKAKVLEYVENQALHACKLVKDLRLGLGHGHFITATEFHMCVLDINRFTDDTIKKCLREALDAGGWPECTMKINHLSSALTCISLYF